MGTTRRGADMGTTRRGADMGKHAPSVGVAGLVTVAAMVVALALALDAPAVRMIAALVGCLVLPGPRLGPPAAPP